MSKNKLILNAVLAGMLSVMAVSTASAATDTYTQTKYPIILVHGFASSDQVLGFSTFYNIPDELKKGGAKVYAAKLSGFNSDEVRGEELIKYLDNLRATSGYEKFNLIGNSQGGLTTRYVAAVRPDLVASVTTGHTPHQGAAPADLIKAVLPEGSPLRPIVAGVINTFASLMGGKADALAALGQLSSSGAAEFTERYPQGKPATACGEGEEVVDAVRYYSFGGVGVATNLLDPTDLSAQAASLTYLGKPNDGIVGQCSSHWGTVLRDDYFWNHFDSVNQTFGLRSMFSSNPVTVYRAHANRLKNLGL
ncbi:MULTISPECIES: triacylglycerol lipase [unclassified Lysobacter]|uniref:esterase/lipase family protein n=1 Tax=unclassified Lysobacter TaxID=2635362 RepID=UPI001BE9BCE1|nr:MULTISPECIES: triacylglycerol lipase [unclassified Lysobacter]MBT2748723.1 triacylglycerol lipase [Lysobacter sp. ISL-42]MBT2751658.1 triacylglycerol lipase [Lysobacter sp. ISL-50]MBT2775852.1 triacylglycerol lipase [Lysobacter sp. ISL-54]MBT2782184.1 triacylglycerol lipase [Lysobacter sp. ISL-52]